TPVKREVTGSGNARQHGSSKRSHAQDEEARLPATAGWKGRAHVVSLQRTQAERREQVTKMLLFDSSRSDRAIARGCATSHSLVGTVRRELVKAGRIDQRPRPN